MIQRSLITFTALSLLIAGCAEDRVETAEPETTLEEGTVALTVEADGQVWVRFARRAEQVGPRVIELKLAITGTLKLASHHVGDALTAADKSLTVQDNGQIRLIALSTGNTNRVDSGVLARLQFQGSGQVQLLHERPFFAPAEADEGIQLGPSVQVDFSEAK